MQMHQQCSDGNPYGRRQWHRALCPSCWSCPIKDKKWAHRPRSIHWCTCSWELQRCQIDLGYECPHLGGACDAELRCRGAHRYGGTGWCTCICRLLLCGGQAVVARCMLPYAQVCYLRKKGEGDIFRYLWKMYYKLYGGGREFFYCYYHHKCHACHRLYSLLFLSLICHKWYEHHRHWWQHPRAHHYMGWVQDLGMEQSFGSGVSIDRYMLCGSCQQCPKSEAQWLQCIHLCLEQDQKRLIKIERQIKTSVSLPLA